MKIVVKGKHHNRLENGQLVTYKRGQTFDGPQSEVDAFPDRLGDPAAVAAAVEAAVEAASKPSKKAVDLRKDAPAAKGKGASKAKGAEAAKATTSLTDLSDDALFDLAVDLGIEGADVMDRDALLTAVQAKQA